MVKGSAPEVVLDSNTVFKGFSLRNLGSVASVTGLNYYGILELLSMGTLTHCLTDIHVAWAVSSYHET